MTERRYTGKRPEPARLDICHDAGYFTSLTPAKRCVKKIKNQQAGETLCDTS